MQPARTLTRALPKASAPTTALRQGASRLPRRRFQSTASGSSTNGSAEQPSHFASGIAGGVVGAGLLYGIYYFSPTGKAARKLNYSLKEVDKKYQQIADTLKEKTPSTDDAISKLKEVCNSYAGWIPGGKHYVDKTFEDLEAVRDNNREEVDKLVSDMYKRLQDITKAGLSFEALEKAYAAISELGSRLASMAGNSADAILERHPELKEKVGGSIDQLKHLGDQYGPEAKKMANETWDQVKDIMKSGFSLEAANKVRKLVDEKTQEIKKIGDKAWKEGLEQAKPYLEKNDKIKKLIEENSDALKQGNAGQLFEQVKKAAESGDFGKLEDYVKSATEKAKSAGGSALSSGSSMLGGGGTFAALSHFMGGQGGKIKENLEVLSKVVESKSKDGENLLKETKEDLKKLLEEKARKAQKIAEEAQAEAK